MELSCNGLLSPSIFQRYCPYLLGKEEETRKQEKIGKIFDCIFCRDIYTTVLRFGKKRKNLPTRQEKKARHNVVQVRFLVGYGSDQASESTGELSILPVARHGRSSTRQKLPRRHLYCLRDWQPYRAPRCLYKLRAGTPNRVDFLSTNFHRTSSSLFTRDCRSTTEARRRWNVVAGRLQIAFRRRGLFLNQLPLLQRQRIPSGTKERRSRCSFIEGRKNRVVRVKLLTSQEIQTKLSNPLRRRCAIVHEGIYSVDTVKSILNYCLSVYSLTYLSVPTESTSRTSTFQRERRTNDENVKTVDRSARDFPRRKSITYNFLVIIVR